MATIAAVATAVPPHPLPQADAVRYARELMPGAAELISVFENARIASRALVRPVPWYLQPHGFGDRMEAYAEAGLALAKEAATAALAAWPQRPLLVPAGGAAPASPGRPGGPNGSSGSGRTTATSGGAGGSPGPDAIGAIVFVSTTGVAAPSLDARLAAALGLPQDTLRVPLWGLGCAGGVAGLARAADLADATGRAVLLVCYEACSLAFALELTQGKGGLDKKNLVAASLFGDGCAAAVVAPGQDGLRVVRSGSHLFPDTERVMGWDVHDDRFDVVLSPRIPHLVRDEMAPVVHGFLDGTVPDHHVLHPGGAKVVDAMKEALRLPPHALTATEDVLRRHGNMSSPTVLFVLKEMMEGMNTGETALLAALGPGFAAELLLLEQT